MHKRFILALLIILMASSFVFAVQYERIEKMEMETRPSQLKSLPTQTSVVIEPPFPSENVEIVKHDNAIAMLNPDGRISLACVLDGWSNASEARVRIIGKKLSIGKLGPNQGLKATVKLNIPFRVKNSRKVASLSKTDDHMKIRVLLNISRYEPAMGRYYLVPMREDFPMMDERILYENRDIFSYEANYYLYILHPFFWGEHTYSVFSEKGLPAGIYRMEFQVEAYGDNYIPGSGAVIANLKIDEIKLEVFNYE